MEKALTRIRKAHPGAILEIAHEAGPWGFVIARSSNSTSLAWSPLLLSSLNNLVHLSKPTSATPATLLRHAAPEAENEERGQLNLNGPFRREVCGAMAFDWSQATPSEGTCICRACIKRKSKGPAWRQHPNADSLGLLTEWYKC